MFAFVCFFVLFFNSKCFLILCGLGAVQAAVVLNVCGSRAVQAAVVLNVCGSRAVQAAVVLNKCGSRAVHAAGFCTCVVQELSRLQGF